MRTLLLLFFVVGSISTPSFSQNLVNNWSFEDSLSCPFTLGQIWKCPGWSTASGTVDYFHSCNTGQAGVPQNVIDYQIPRSGNAYAGIVSYHTSGYKEHIITELNQPLQIGTNYFVTFYVSLALNSNSLGQNVNIASNKIGAFFSTTFFVPTNPPPISNNAHVYTNTIITDTSNWTLIQGSYVADSNYTHLTIGNFFSDSLINTIFYDSLARNSYYFIDDVCVSMDSLFCDQLLSTPKALDNFIINIFPNPARDWLEVRGRNIHSLLLYDVSGRIVKSFNISVPQTINISSLPTGVYIASIETTDGIFFKKIIINH